MTDTASDHRRFGWSSAFRIGSNTFAANAFWFWVALVFALSTLPFLSYAFGTGILPALFTIIALFGLLLVFKNLIFKQIYKNPIGDGDAALIEYLVQQNASGAPGEEEVEMELLENALHLKQLRARDCMAPRPEVVYVDVHAPVEALQQQFADSRLSRILVIDGDLDNVLGYVHVQQLFNAPAHIKGIVMPITFVPEIIPVNDLLHKFVKNRTNIACVVDEYGSLAGIITMEDVLEQLFGDIEDEHDEEEFIEIRVSERAFLFSGRLEVDYLNDKYPELALPPGEYNTLSGYLVTQAQTIPEQGARLEIAGKIFQLELVSDRKIETVRVLLPDTTEEM
jgi:putative hemolysin